MTAESFSLVNCGWHFTRAGYILSKHVLKTTDWLQRVLEIVPTCVVSL